MMEEFEATSDSNEDIISSCVNQKSSSFNRKNFSSQLSDSNESGIFNETSRLQVLEQEHEKLNSSLMALTTHFAQVQFRLKQIVVAPNEDKERLLKELEEFAFQGCSTLETKNNLDTSYEKIVDEQRRKHKKLIDQLAEQLLDIENYTNFNKELGEEPLNMIIEKQRIIIDELKEKMNMPLENFNKLSKEELKKIVDNAIYQIVNPNKIKEQLVNQLKTQIEDLERFIDFLQGNASSPGPYLKKNICTCSDKTSESAFPIFNQPTKSNENKSENKSTTDKNTLSNEADQQTAIEILKKILSVMQIFALTQFGCGTNSIFEKNTIKKTSNHWGDLRANLELAINKVMKIHFNLIESRRFENKFNLNTSDGNLNYDEEVLNFECPNELIRAVRKDLACSLRDLLQHGLFEKNNHNSKIAPFGCFVVRSKENQNQLHAWDLFYKYYEMKHGKEFTQSAANKLSQSFSLNVISGKIITIKQSFFNAIENVLKIHKYESSNKDSCFKAFVCLAINEKKLVQYIKQILKTTIIIENYYANWSYIKTTGFDDALKSLDQLKILNPNLPVDKSTRRRSINKNNQKELF